METKEATADESKAEETPASSNESTPSASSSSSADKLNIPAGTDEIKEGQRKHFSRVDRSKINFEAWELTDNTYKGAAGTWGEKANEKLGRVRGKDFTKNKNKMKRGSYRGGSITLESGSYKFQD